MTRDLVCREWPRLAETALHKTLVIVKDFVQRSDRRPRLEQTILFSFLDNGRERETERERQRERETQRERDGKIKMQSFTVHFKITPNNWSKGCLPLLFIH